MRLPLWRVRSSARGNALLGPAVALTLVAVGGCTSSSVREPGPSDLPSEELESRCEQAIATFQWEAQRHRGCVEDDDCTAENLHLLTRGCCYPTSRDWRHGAEGRALLDAAFLQCRHAMGDAYCPKPCTAACVDQLCVGRSSSPWVPPLWQ
ncbi:hypothetical protein WA016_01089 [Myxococcus stipitatus]